MNRLTGSIPQELGSCTELLFLQINDNDLTGYLPTTLGSLWKLQIALDVSNNKLTGGIPAQLGNLVMLDLLNLSHNKFNGTIPSSFSRMVSLSILDVSYNNLEGPLPTGRQFSNASIGWFVHNNGLCGYLSGLPTCFSSPTMDHDNPRTHILVPAISIPLCILIIFIMLELL
jgi:hypothetical protein